MKSSWLLTAAALAAPLAFAHPALAAPGDPITFADELAFDPIVDARLRYENVDQPGREADAVTARVRAGFEIKHAGGFAILAEAEGTLAIQDDYNAFPFAIASSQRRPAFAVVADPENVELNRLQLQYKSKAATFTLGRQRINLDDQRWVGSVGWRQNEQTFDAVRGEAKLGRVALDGIYAIGQRSIFGVDSGPRQAMDGDFVLFGAGAKLGPVQAKAFAYLLDYGEPFMLGMSSQSYGARATTAVPLGSAKLNLVGSYARQMDYGDNPVDYEADYVLGEAALTVRGLTLSGGWEKLGADASVPGGKALQTPLATLHKFNGWADLFLTTPNAGLEDAYAGIAYKFDGVKALPGLNAAVVYHQFDSDLGDLEYGTEWNASIGFKLGRVALLAKFADYEAVGFAVDTRKFWLQAEIAY